MISVTYEGLDVGDEHCHLTISGQTYKKLQPSILTGLQPGVEIRLISQRIHHWNHDKITYVLDNNLYEIDKVDFLLDFPCNKFMLNEGYLGGVNISGNVYTYLIEIKDVQFQKKWNCVGFLVRTR